MGFWRRKGWIGVHLGVRTLRLAQVERVGSGMRIAASVAILRSLTRKTDTDPVVQGLQWSGQDILAALSLDPGFSGRRVACVLPMCFTDLHTLEIPPGDDSERRAMVAHQLSSTFSGDGEEREFDFWEADSNAPARPSTTKAVNSLSVPRNLVSFTVRNLSDARLRCEVMDGLPFTLARAVRLAYGRNGKHPIAAVNWGFTSGTFSVVSDGRPKFTRHLRSCGLGATIVPVSRALGLSEDAVMQLLTKHGLPNPKCQAGSGREIQEVIAEVAAKQLNEITDELKKTIAYLHKRGAAMAPQRLCLFGEGATMKNVSAFFSHKVGLPVEGWRLPDSDDGNRLDSKNRSELLGTAVALSTLAWES